MQKPLDLWKLNNRISYHWTWYLETQAQCEEISLKHFEKTQKSKLLRANETLKKKFTVAREGTLIYNVLESLILAQDERWRRA